MKSRVISSILSASGLLMLVSCSPKSTNMASITLQLPDFAHQRATIGATGPQLAHLVINVSAPDIQPIYFAWDMQGGISSPPSSVSLDVPKGSARLIQVVGALMDPNTGNMTFDYGDVRQDLNDDTDTVSVTIDPVGGTSTGQGGLIGRYLSAAGTGPTGIVRIMYTPPDGTPPMIIQQGEIFGGFTDLFALQNQPFNYVFEDGTTLFSNVSTSSAALYTNSTEVVLVPAAYRSWGGSTSGFELQQSEQYVVGYFGPGVSGESACYDSTNGGDIPNMFTSSALSTALQWYSPPGTTYSGVSTGGTPLTNTSCISPNAEFTNFIKFNENNLAQHDGLADFYGPFVVNQTPNGTTTVTGAYAAVPGTMTLSWQLVPGATVGLDGFEVFYRLGQSNSGQTDYQIDDGYACDQLVSSYGFTSAGRVGTSGTSMTIFGIAPSFIQNGQFQAVVCPYRLNSPFAPFSGSAFYFHTAANYQNYGSSSALYNLAWLSTTPTTGVTISDNTDLNDGSTCKPYTIQLQDSAGNPYTTPTPTNVSATVSGGPISLFTDPGCSNSISSVGNTLTIPASANNVAVYAQSTTTAGYSTLTLSANDTQFNSLSVDLASAPAGTPPTDLTANVLAVDTILAEGQCYPVNYRLEISGGTPSFNTSAYSGITPTGPVVGTFHNAVDCSDATITNFTIPAYSHGVTLYFSPTATGTGVFSSSVSGLTPVSSTTINVGSDLPTSYTVSIPVTAPTQCSQVNFNFADSVGATVYGNVPPITVTLTASGLSGSFYSDPNCTVAIGPSDTVNLGGNTPSVYYGSTGVSGTDTISVTNTGSLTANQPSISLSW